MTKLSKIDATRLAATIAVIQPLFARACDRMTGHSHAAEKMSTKPTVGRVSVPGSSEPRAGTDDCLLAGDGFDDAERSCRLHYALQPEAAPPE